MYRLIKRICEILVVTVFLAVLFPAMLLIALFILACDRHNPFFIQKRSGYRGVLFSLLKFRTMKGDDPKNPDGTSQAVFDGRRVTTLGAILRKICLDELPQLVNILMGDMSLIGPRPRLDDYEENNVAKHVYDGRYQARPGITGLAQVYYKAHGGNVPVAEIVLLDRYYVRYQSVLLDLRVAVCTLVGMLTGSWNYTWIPVLARHQGRKKVEA